MSCCAFPAKDINTFKVDKNKNVYINGVKMPSHGEYTIKTVADLTEYQKAVTITFVAHVEMELPHYVIEDSENSLK